VGDTKKPDPYGVEQTASTAQKHLFSERIQDGVRVIQFSRSDVLDAHYIERLGDDIYHHLKEVDEPRVVIDLHNVEFLSSSALGMLIALKKVIDKQRGKLCLANVRADLVKVFKITKLHKLLKMHDSADDAVDSIA
jgi:anti-anti-sigma factor